jgi:hypothetical protein
MIISNDTTYLINNLRIENPDSVKAFVNLSNIERELELLKNQIKLDNSDIVKAIIENGKEESFLPFISNDALASTGITLLVFLLGFLVRWVVIYFERKKKRTQIKSFIHFYLKKITTGYNPKIYKAYLDFSTNTTIDSGIVLTPPKILSNDFLRILKMDSKEVFEAFKEKNEITDILGQTEFLNKLLDEVQQFHEKALSRSNELRSDLEIMINDYVETLVEFVDFEKYNTINYKKSQHYLHFNKSILDYYDEIAGTPQIEKFKNDILRVNQAYVVNTDLYTNHPVGNKIAKKGKNLSYLLSNIEIHTNEFKKQYKEFADMVNNSNNSLIGQISKIKWNSKELNN